MVPVDEDPTPLTRPIIVEGDDGDRHVINTIAKAAKYLTGRLGRIADTVTWQAAAVSLEAASRDKSETHLRLATDYIEYACRIEGLLRR